ncbi:peroxisome assembly factor 2 isoform X1 [Schistocerca piceifrons]|uniref:peroxisome assembly factor 2 isoform X1 n=1 Tax=Schistocerca piceifrons TaxID=274613 RepID=UPI001F5FA029|nr:peroxisome assembly factor 2 isoform X1 [Schistocerca piceifrons]
MKKKTRAAEVATLLSVLRFTARILLPRHHNALFPIFSTLFIAYKNQKMRNISVSLVPLPDDILLELIPGSLHEVIVDSNSCLFVSSSILDELRVANGHWVKVQKTDSKIDSENESEQTLKCVLVQIIGLVNLDPPTALISDVKYDNLKNSLELSDNHSISILGRQVDQSFVPSKANKAAVRYVKRPPDIDNALMDVVLTKYFKHPRYLCENELFCINVLHCAPEIRYMPGNQGIEKLYFVVEEITGESYTDDFLKDVKMGYFVEQSSSTLIQAGCHQRCLPSVRWRLVADKTTLAASNYDSHLITLCPWGLEKYSEELERCLRPFILNTRSLKVKPMFLLYGQRGCGKMSIISSVAQKLGLGIWSIDCLEIQSGTAASTEGKLKFAFSKVKQFAPCIMLMNNIEYLCKTKNEEEDARTICVFHEEAAKLFSNVGDLTIILIAVCDNRSESLTNITADLARAFLDTMRVSSPSETERLSMLEWLVRSRSLHLETDVSLPYYASQTSGFVLADLEALISHAVRNHYKQLKKFGNTLVTEDNEDCGRELKKEDFEVALDIMHSTYADVIGAPKIPAVSWDDIGGLSKLKEEIFRTVMMPLKHPELVASGLRRSGLLLFGPPGTGKTLLAKAIATECSLNFLSVKGPELLNMYVGQSEMNVREVFERARSAAPCIIFFDELDSLAPSRGRSGDSGGVMDRVVSQLLAEMDGVQKSTQIFLIGATNRPDLIDAALLRPGRFDKLLYVGMCEDNETKLSVLKALTRKFKLKTDVNLSDVVEQFPDVVTGADVYSVCSKAWLSAVRSIVHKVQEATPEDRATLLSTTVEVSVEDFSTAVANIKPSVSDEDMAYYRKVQKEMSAV